MKYNVTNIMKEMQKPYCVITADNAWSRPSSEEIFHAVPHDNKEMHVIPEASHFDMYDLAPFVSEAPTNTETPLHVRKPCCRETPTTR